MKCAALIVISIFIGALQSCNDKASTRNATQMTAKPELNDTDKYILDAIRKKVWSGFYTPDEVDSMVDDLLEGDAHEDFLREAIAPEFAKKREAEKTWPEQTDCDRLDAAFRALEQRGILCLQNAGYTMSEGEQEAFEMLSDQPDDKYSGYCFYHGQDLENAVDGGGLMIAFNYIVGKAPGQLGIGLALKEELERAGFTLEWNGTAEKRINIPNIEWKRRYRKEG